MVCTSCGLKFDYISNSLPYCRDCLIKGKGLQDAKNEHKKIRKCHRDKNKINFIKCLYCVNRCEISEGEYGDCGLRFNKNGRIYFELKDQNYAILDYYYDPLPTNCVADWVCAGSAEIGSLNLAVFYRACSFSCLFCQNYHFRDNYGKKLLSAEELAKAVTKRTSCICFFGGDPAPQIIHALRTSQIARKNRKGEILRICFETNGSMNKKFLKKMIELSLESGGCIKFDLKAITIDLHKALTGSSNEWTLENIKFVAEYIDKRPERPLLVVSTPLVPGYINADEIEKISNFLASISKDIPYALLAYYPCYKMIDTRKTSRDEALSCLERAKSSGLKRVRIGNYHLLY